LNYIFIDNSMNGTLKNLNFSYKKENFMYYNNYNSMIDINYCKNITIQNSIFSTNDYENMYYNYLEIYYSHYTKILYNNFTYGGPAIYINYSNNTSIKNNTITGYLLINMAIDCYNSEIQFNDLIQINSTYYMYDYSVISGSINNYNNSWNYNHWSNYLNIEDSDEDGYADTPFEAYANYERTEFVIDQYPIFKDQDLDDLDELTEIYYYHTNPYSNDTDNDGLTDYQEVKGVYGYITNPLTDDSDNEGLNDYEEIFIYETNPIKADTDGDLFNDYQEIIIGTDPKDPYSFPGGILDEDKIINEDEEESNEYESNLSISGYNYIILLIIITLLIQIIFGNKKLKLKIRRD